MNQSKVRFVRVFRFGTKTYKPGDSEDFVTSFAQKLVKEGVANIIKGQGFNKVSFSARFQAALNRALNQNKGPCRMA